MTKEEQLVQLVNELYEEHERRFQPMNGWVFIRVLPKEQKIGRIYTPDHQQNKPMYEGIVIQTWKPWTEERPIRYKIADDTELVDAVEIIHHKSYVAPGDRVLFPHYEGQPVGQVFDERFYRIIPESVVQAIVHYDDDKKIRTRLHELMSEVPSVTLSGV